MKEGNRVFFTNRIGQEKKATIIKVLQDDRLLLETDDEEGKEYVTSEKHCEMMCEECDGEGKTIIPAYQQAGEIIKEQETECSLCKGTGKI